MKAVRFITLFIVLAIAFSVWTPGVVYASPANSGVNSVVEKAKSDIVKINISNKTGATLYLELSGEGRSYSFSTSTPGKATFQVLPGRYTYILHTSGCPGSVTRTKAFKGTVNLGTWICRH